jgi:hypothetical protein
MAKQQMSFKQLAINKDNSTILLVVALASFLVVFSLVASNALLKQRSYQAKVIGQKKVALKQLETNVQEAEKLKTSYQVFAEDQQNLLGGSSEGSGDKDGDNPRLILDALPSKYDFPGLATSLEKVFKQYSIKSISGTDDEIAQSEVPAAGLPQPIEIPFAVSVGSSPQASKQMLEIFEKSIRPIQINNLAITGQADEVRITVDAVTYYQPQRVVEVRMEKVK